MGEQIEWALSSGHGKLRADHVGSAIAKYIIGNPGDDPPNLERLPDVLKMVRAI